MNSASRDASRQLVGIPFGINLVGYLESEKGVGEAMRAGLRSVRAAGIPHVVNNFVDTGSMNSEMGFAISESNPYSTNLVYVSPDHLPQLFLQKHGYFSHRFNVGCWSWELSSFPEEWGNCFRYFHEIWVPSTFVLEAVSKVCPLPVVTMPHSLEPHRAPQPEGCRNRWALPSGTFVFLFMFDLHSTLERKNPLGLIEAFRRAFESRTDVLLLIKCLHSATAPGEFDLLRQASKAANVMLLDAVMSHESIRCLMAACDCYVSLHRAEGFGLPLAEAMALGKPVVATGYSGNLDFMNARNSFLVRYRLVEIDHDHGPYKKGNVWAEPDLDHAAELLQRVFLDRKTAAAIATQGKKDVWRRLHPAVIGTYVKERLLTASQQELVRRTQELSQRSEELRAALNESARRLGTEEADRRQQSEAWKSKEEQLQSEVGRLTDRLQDEQAFRQVLEGEFRHLRYRVADRVNSLAKKVPGLQRALKFGFSFVQAASEGIKKGPHREFAGTAGNVAGPARQPGEEEGRESSQPERRQLPPPRYPPRPAPPIPPQSANFAGCTIAAPNYLAQARVLAKSFRDHNPACPFFVLIMGRVDGYFDPSQEPFFVVESDSFEIPDRDGFFFKYNLLEASTAVKPYFLEHLLSRHNFCKLVYMDPDILVTHSLASLSTLLDRYAIILTPHLTAPIRDGFQPGEFQILQAGAHNLGFIGVRKSEVTQEMLSWWQQKVHHHCLMAPERGMHVDQRWVDLVPGMFSDVHVLRDPGYNVAYWNLYARRVTVNNGEISVNGQPGYFFHFSGFSPQEIESVSRHQNRFRLGDLGDARIVFERYRELVLAAGREESEGWPYSCDYFDNGVRIPDVARRTYWSLGKAATKFGNPFSTEAGSLFHWLNEPVDGEKNPSRLVTRLWYEIYKRRADLRSVFPDVLGVHREAFLKWIREKNLDEFGVAPCFLPGALPPTDRPPRRDREVRCDAAGPFGVNVVGYFYSEKGMGEAVRADIRSLEAAGIPHVLNNFADHSAANVEKVSVGLAEENPYKINLFHVNADQVPVLFQQKKENFGRRYNIGYWTWELSDFPREWQLHFSHFNEIWVPTTFVKDAVARVSPIPVFSVPYALNPEPAIGRGWTRARFGLSPESFVFLFFFDFYSVMERKNPLGLVRAFREAFGDRTDVVLFIKCSHSEGAPEEMERLRQACQGSNLKLQDAVWPREAINALLATCDCYVSLHRSEGFGLTLAEAMYLGKPVIATAYSGNMDFMREDNSFLARYKLVKLEQDYGPYKKGCVWAEPDLDHAAHLMRSVFENREAAGSVAEKGRRGVSDQLHPEVVGATMRERLLKAIHAVG